MKVLCKRNYIAFKAGESYDIHSIHSIFEKDDFISIISKEHYLGNTTHTVKSTHVYRFRMNKSVEYIEDYIGENENYFYDYFCNIKEERKTKLQHLSE